MPPTDDPLPSCSLSAPNTQPTNPINPSRHPCVTCQRRKVKCDRRSPCTRCLTYGHECAQPALQREPRRPARKSQDLVARVRQLEDALEEAREKLRVHETTNENVGAEMPVPVEASVEVKEEGESLDSLLGHLIIGEDKSRYISTSSWANFAWEVSYSHIPMFNHVLTS